VISRLAVRSFAQAGVVGPDHLGHPPMNSAPLTGGRFGTPPPPLTSDIFRKHRGPKGGDRRAGVTIPGTGREAEGGAGKPSTTSSAAGRPSFFLNHLFHRDSAIPGQQGRRPPGEAGAARGRWSNGPPQAAGADRNGRAAGTGVHHQQRTRANILKPTTTSSRGSDQDLKCSGSMRQRRTIQLKGQGHRPRQAAERQRA